MTAPWFELDGTTLTLRLKVQPRSTREGIDDLHGDRLRVRLNAPPVDDQANAALLVLLARTFGVPRTSISIVQGGQSRLKTVRLPRPAMLPDWFEALAGDVAARQGSL